MSNINNEQLFTELTPEQAAILEGGLQVQLTKLECLQATDTDGANIADEVFVSYLTNKPPAVVASAVNGPDVNFGSPTTMSTGTIKNIQSLSPSSSSGVQVNFFDKDGSSILGSEFLGSFFASKTGFQQVRGVGGRYRVTFNAF